MVIAMPQFGPVCQAGTSAGANTATTVTATIAAGPYRPKPAMHTTPM